MCGLLGCVVKREKSSDVLNNSLQLIGHRGPDHSDYIGIKQQDYNLYLGHSRLSIIDLTDSGNQPFKSPCGRYSIVFNGEIYNFKELREELKSIGYHFETCSDTEVLLFSLIEWKENCLKKLIGMFAFVFFDRKKLTLMLVRDAFGIKPLYYEYNDGELYFASELSALTSLREKKVKPNLQVAYDYLIHGDYDSTSFTFIEGINSLPPSSIIKYSLNDGYLTQPESWWTPNISTNNEIKFENAVEKLRSLFLDSVKLHLRSDVPLGVALSGGIDSSAVVSAVRYLEPDISLNTFSYIAGDNNISEEPWVDSLNEEMNSIPHKVYANEKEMCQDLDHLLLMQGEPFGGTSLYAQYRVFQLANSAGIKVTLDGQGADELLAGYSGYPGHRLLSIIETEGWLAAHKFVKKWSQSPGRNYILAWKYLARIKLSDKLYKIIRKLSGRDFEPKWLNIELMKQNGISLHEKRPCLSSKNRGARVKEALVNSLLGRGLPALLRHGDRNSMSFSIESRVPFLTIPIAEFLLSLPEKFLISNDGITKHIFRESMRGIVPDEHLDRKDKVGFETPESSWLMTMMPEIRGWISKTPNIDFINKKQLLQELEEIEQGSKPFDKKVWRWLNYLRWYTLNNVKQ